MGGKRKPKGALQTFVDASFKIPDRHAVHSNAPKSVSVFVSEFLGQVLEATVESELYWPGLLFLPRTLV